MGEALASDFKGAMRALTSTVSIISTSQGGRRFGMTATAVTSVSMAPPSLLVCVNQAASLHVPLIESGRFCVNILQAWQGDLAHAFGSRTIADRFAHGAWLRDDRALPYLADAQANVFCDVDDVHAYGTHTVVIGRVYGVGVQAPVHPLLYQDGRYTVGLSDGVDWVIPIAG
jgi:flavin reductase